MLDELKFRYRALSLSIRLFLLVCIGVIPGALTYFDEAPDLESQLEAATGTEGSNRQRLATAKAQAKNLPAMEEKLQFTTDQLKKAETRLPSFVMVDQVVEQIGKSAKEADVDIRYFAPSGEKTIPGEYPYDEVRFKVTMAGKFPDLSQWMDVVAGHESKAYIKSWEFNRESSSGPSRRQKIENPEEALPANLDSRVALSKRDIALKAREDYSLTLKAELAFYRVASMIPPKPTPGQAQTKSSPAASAALPPSPSSGSPQNPGEGSLPPPAVPVSAKPPVPPTPPAANQPVTPQQRGAG